MYNITNDISVSYSDFRDELYVYQNGKQIFSLNNDNGELDNFPKYECESIQLFWVMDNYSDVIEDLKT